MSLKVFDGRIKAYGNTSEKVCIILVGDDPEKEEHIVSEGKNRAFVIGLKVEDWNSELSPWIAPPVFQKEPFGNGADDLLNCIEKEIIPFVTERFGQKDFLLAGYSLAGLFALYSVYKSTKFTGAIAVSPSVWFPGWPEFISDKKPNAGFIYLSLGDKEEKTKIKAMSCVGDNIRGMHKLLLEQGIDTCLEWNEGGHFKDVESRIGKGIAAGLHMYETV